MPGTMPGRRAIAVADGQCLAQKQSDIGLIGISDRPMHLDRLSCHQHRGFGRAGLGARNSGLGIISAVKRDSGVPDDGTGNLDLDLQIHGAMLKHLKTADQPVELPAGP